MQRNTAAQDKVQELDEAAWKSPLFWTEVKRELSGLEDDPAMLRFRGFCDNLRICEPGDILTLDNGQELFTQYTFPGLIDAELPREPFPPLDAAPAWANTLAGAGAVAQEELLAALAEVPGAEPPELFLNCAPPAGCEKTVQPKRQRARTFRLR